MTDDRATKPRGSMLTRVKEEDRTIAAAAVNPAACHCSTCGHQWTFAFLPMPLERFAALAKVARCPKGCRSQTFMGTVP